MGYGWTIRIEEGREPEPVESLISLYPYSFTEFVLYNTQRRNRCIVGNRKRSFVLIPSHKIIEQLLTVRILPPTFTCLICGESYRYWVQENNSSVHSVTVILSYDTLVLTTSSLSPSSTSSIFFFLPWERVSWTFLLPVTMPVFQLGSLAI